MRCGRHDHVRHADDFIVGFEHESDNKDSLIAWNDGQAQGGIGPDCFAMPAWRGSKVLVFKHKDRPYRAGRSPHLVKVKNRKHPAMERVPESFWFYSKPLPGRPEPIRRVELDWGRKPNDEAISYLPSARSPADNEVRKLGAAPKADPHWGKIA